MKWLIVLICLLLSHASFSQGKHLFILSGQSNMAALNPAVSFIPTVSRALDHDGFIVVKDAHGGQSIKRWVPYGDLYEELINKVDYVLEYESIQAVTFVWMQGEQDTKHSEDYVNYLPRLNSLIDQLQSDIGDQKLYVVVGRLSPYKNGQLGWDKVRQTQVEFANTKDDYAWVDTDDIDRKRIHYTDFGYKQLGKRFADAAIKQILQ